MLNVMYVDHQGRRVRVFLEDTQTPDDVKTKPDFREWFHYGMTHTKNGWINT